jgi:hypothetical protein
VGEEPTTPQNNPQAVPRVFEEEAGGNRRPPIKRMETTGFEPGSEGRKSTKLSVFQFRQFFSFFRADSITRQAVSYESPRAHFL